MIRLELGTATGAQSGSIGQRRMGWKKALEANGLLRFVRSIPRWI